MRYYLLLLLCYFDCYAIYVFLLTCVFLVSFYCSCVRVYLLVFSYCLSVWCCDLLFISCSVLNIWLLGSMAMSFMCKLSLYNLCMWYFLVCSLLQWFSTIMRPRPIKFFFYKTRAQITDRHMNILGAVLQQVSVVCSP
jgi:hypothetical protein